MSVAPTNTVMLAVSLIALTFAFVARVVAGRQRSVEVQHSPGSPSNAMNRLADGSDSGADYERRSAARAPQGSPPRTVNGASVSESDTTRFSQAWQALQSRFVDDPRAVVADADHLVRELLERRGYSVDERFDHPAVVTTYLAAQAITTRHGRSEADTEALRKAVVYYRGVFDTLLKTPPIEAGS